jgi:hypothetical protein
MSSAAVKPRIGQWYERTDTGDVFQVTGLDEDDRTIEIQSFDGDVDEIESPVWAGLPLEPAAPPEDWMVPVEDMDAQDLACSQAQRILENPLALEQYS